MNRVRDAKRIAAPLLARYADFALIKRAIIVKPVRHVARFIYLDGTSSRGQFVPRWAFMAMFHRSSDWSFSDGGLIFRWSSPRLWYWDEPNIGEILLKESEHQAIPKLHTMQTFKDYADAVLLKSPAADVVYRPTRFIYNVALGNLDAAKQVFVDQPDAPLVKKLNEHRPSLGYRLLERGSDISNEDRQALATMLREWELFTIKSLKLEKIWEPTPFPLEFNQEREPPTLPFNSS